MNLAKEVSLKCLFCGLVLDVDESIANSAKSGDQIKCKHCNEINDFDAMHKVADKDIEKMLELDFQKELDSMF